MDESENMTLKTYFQALFVVSRFGVAILFLLCSITAGYHYFEGWLLKDDTQEILRQKLIGSAAQQVKATKSQFKAISLLRLYGKADGNDVDESTIAFNDACKDFTELNPDPEINTRNVRQGILDCDNPNATLNQALRQNLNFVRLPQAP